MASLPRKWSMRNTADSGKCCWMVALSSTADARSRPNGFSTMRRAPLLSPTSARPPATHSNIDGGMAMWKIGCSTAPTACLSFTNVCGSSYSPET